MVRTHGIQSGTKSPGFLDRGLGSKERCPGPDERMWGIGVPVWNWQKQNNQ